MGPHHQASLLQQYERRKPIAIETMLRMYLFQNWFNLSDEGIEDAIYASYAMKKFLHIDFSDQQVFDATTLLHFRHMLEKHDLQKAIFDSVKDRLNRAGLLMHGGTIVDATILKAPSSTKNRTKTRDPEMHSTRKGNQWYFGMKEHIGVDAGTGYTHTAEATVANVSDVAEAHKLVREDDHIVYGDSGYLGMEKRPEAKADEHLSSLTYRICARPSQNCLIGNYDGENWDRAIEHQKSSVRCKVEHAFHIVKNLFRRKTTRYYGLAKNHGISYFLRFSNEYRKRMGDEALDRNNWYEYVEYGITNPLTILLQRDGFSGEAVCYIKGHKKYVIREGSSGVLKLSRALATCSNTDVRNEVVYIRQNSPEIFEIDELE